MGLQLLPHPQLPTWISKGLVLRGKALQDYLLELRGVLQGFAEIPSVTLMVLSEADWKDRVRHPYGFPFQRTSLSEGLYLFAPARYPERFLWRLRETMLPAAKQNRLPGRIEDFLDLNLGHELAHAVQVAWGLRTRVRWVDEFLANYLYLLALQQAYPQLYPQALAWGERLATLTPSQPSLSNYERKPSSLSDQLWFQGAFTTQAALWVAQGEPMLRALLAQAPLRKGTVHKVLLTLEPGLKEWFASFAPRRQPPTGEAPLDRQV